MKLLKIKFLFQHILGWGILKISWGQVARTEGFKQWDEGMYFSVGLWDIRNGDRALRTELQADESEAFASNNEEHKRKLVP